MAWRLWGKKVVVVGGGAIGEGTVETLLRSGANIVVIDPTPSARICELAEANTLTLHRRLARRRDLRHAALVVAATGDHETNGWIARWARRFGAIVNAVDDPELCDVTVPAVSHVVRLKGGDPFVFGRGYEEIEAATHAGLDVEIVPGLSSSIAAATLSRIPLTDRRHAASFTVVSGHRAGDGDYDWESFARDDTTLVVLMAATTARGVAERLIGAGRRAATPVAIIHRAGFVDEQVEVLSLAEVSLVGSPLPAPSVMIVGTVAGLAKCTPPLPASATATSSEAAAAVADVRTSAISGSRS